MYMLVNHPFLINFVLKCRAQRLKISITVEPLYNEVLGSMKITLLYQVSCYIRVKNKEI